MTKLSTAILVMCICLAGCTESPYKRVYEGINNRNDAFKSPCERAMAPPPSYISYQKERLTLNREDVATDNYASPDFNLKQVDTKLADE